MKFPIIAFLYLFSACTYALNESKDINNVLNTNRIKYHLPAVSLSIKLPNSKAQNFVSGYYSLSQNESITPNTLFQVGSITKTFTATILFKLMEENKLSLTENLGKWLPQYPRWKNITIGDLLHHTSGIYNYTSGKYFDNLLRNNPQKCWSLSELANMAYQHADLSIPDEKYNYTNTDYVLLGMIIENAAKKPINQIFSSYLKQYKLTNTFYSPCEYPPAIKNRIAHGYNRDGTFNLNTDVTFVSVSFGQSAGSIISTPNDIVKWLNELFNGEIIKSNSLENMMQIISEKNARSIKIQTLLVSQKFDTSKPFNELGVGNGIGLLYFKNYGITWVHSGGTPGYEAFFAYNPCNGIYLALAYSVKPKQQLIFIQIANQIFRTLLHSDAVIKAIKNYQRNNSLPTYCRGNLI